MNNSKMQRNGNEENLQMVMALLEPESSPVYRSPRICFYSKEEVKKS